MKALIALLLLASPAFAGQSVTVRNSPGGAVEDFDAQAREWARDGVQVRIAGSCSSACNMYLMSKYKLDVCAEKGAKLQFHMPYFQVASAGSWSKVVTPEALQHSKRNWASEWLGQFNPKLNAALARATKNGLIPNPSASADSVGMYSLKAADFIPVCQPQ